MGITYGVLTDSVFTKQQEIYEQCRMGDTAVVSELIRRYFDLDHFSTRRKEVLIFRSSLVHILCLDSTLQR